jgi:hypothetical protein
VWHTTFYPVVEASSVTPFFRAVDRELAYVTVAIPRFGHDDMTTATPAASILQHRDALKFVVDLIVERAETRF